MILVTSYYKCKSDIRQNEINQCLINNSENKYIKKIYLLNNSYYDIDFVEKKEKIQQILTSKNKLKFKEAIQFINIYASNNIIILSNSDIYFNETLSKIIDYDFDNKIFCLLRYNMMKNNEIEIFKHFDEPRCDSQDSWIFKSPLNINLNNVDFSFGTPGCDNIFATELFNSNYELYNPSYDIISIHLHDDNEREDNEYTRIHGNYCLIYPNYLNIPSNIRFMEF